MPKFLPSFSHLHQYNYVRSLNWYKHNQGYNSNIDGFVQTENKVYISSTRVKATESLMCLSFSCMLQSHKIWIWSSLNSDQYIAMTLQEAKVTGTGVNR